MSGSAYDVIHEDRLDYTPDPRSVRLARRRVARLLTEWGHPRLAAEAALLVSELGGNAVRHGRLEGRFFGVRVALTRVVARIEVSDPRGDRRVRAVAAGPEDTAGRGLLLVGLVADRWGVAGGTVGKTVWCELDLTEPVSDGSGRRAAPDR